MRKPLASRIAILTVIYCFAFFFLAMLQFSGKGNFSLSAGAINIKGRYLHEPSSYSQTNISGDIREITGGVKLFYGGLEFNLDENRGKGLMLSGTGGAVYVNPEYFIITDNTVRFGLTGGTVLVFSSFDSQAGSELRLNIEFAENIFEASIPISPRRSSLFRDNGQLGVVYGDSLYSFTGTGGELENGKIILSNEKNYVTYRTRNKQEDFDPSNFIIAQSQNYQNEIQNWKDANYSGWNLNVSNLHNEDDIIAYCAEALARGNYQNAVAAIPRNFLDSAEHTYRSSVFVGGMTNVYRLFTSDEREKQNLITTLTREGSLEILKEEHIIDFLLSRGAAISANEVINLIQNADPEMLISDYCPGLLEAYIDFKLWHPTADNPAEHLIEQLLLLVSENLIRITENDLVFASDSEGINYEFSIRLGAALISWAELTDNIEWEAVGKSLVLSALASDKTEAGKLYNIFNPTENYPRAAWLTDNGHWAWTGSSSVRASYIDGNLNIAVNFPVNLTHYVIVQGVRPFLKIQIHDMDFRSDNQFERYDSSGWVYYPQDQILIIKLKHRSTVENVRIFYRIVEPPPVIEETPEAAQTGAAGDTVLS